MPSGRTAWMPGCVGWFWESSLLVIVHPHKIITGTRQSVWKGGSATLLWRVGIYYPSPLEHPIYRATLQLALYQAELFLFVCVLEIVEQQWGILRGIASTTKTQKLTMFTTAIKGNFCSTPRRWSLASCPYSGFIMCLFLDIPLKVMDTDLWGVMSSSVAHSGNHIQDQFPQKNTSFHFQPHLKNTWDHVISGTYNI